MPAACESVAGSRITFSLSSCLLVPGSWFLVHSQISHLKSHISYLKSKPFSLLQLLT